MTRFERFSEAGRLYAENADVIDEMWNAYLADVARFVESFEALLGARVPGFRTHHTSTANRYWWAGTRGWEASPHLWFNENRPAELAHDGLVLTGGHGSSDPRLLESLCALVARSELGLVAVEGKVNRYYLFTMSIDFEGEGFLERAADRVARVLAAMGEVEAGTTSRARKK